MLIDYEKLKLAHELVLKTHKWAWIETKYSAQEESLEYKLTVGLSGPEEDLYYFDDIDDLITNLKELIPKNIPKYRVGQTVWHLNTEYLPECTVIESIDYCDEENEPIYGVPSLYGAGWLESQVYPSREDLIKAQIEYWTSLKNKQNSTCSNDMSLLSPPYEGEIKGFDQSVQMHEKVECIHEQDFDNYCPYTPNHPHYRKCKRCGEFYR